MEKFRAKLLTSLRTEQLYGDILISGVWSDENRGSLKKPDYIFVDNSDCKERHSTEHITFSFIDTIGETIITSTEHTYRRGSFAVASSQLQQPEMTAKSLRELASELSRLVYYAPGF